MHDDCFERFDGDDEEAMYEKKEGIYLIRTVNSGCDHRCTRSGQHTDLCEANGKSVRMPILPGGSEVDITYG